MEEPMTQVQNDAGAAPRIRVGVGGWTYEPWRDNFYPKGLPHKEELAYASRHLTAIEVNGTFYSTFKPETFAKWRDETPPGFLFSLKAHRFATHRKDLSTAGEPVQRFVNSGLAQLGDKLGPIVWQLMPSTVFDPANIGAFFALLPREVAGRPLQHVLDARHPSFQSAAYLELAQQHGCATVHADSDAYPGIADPGSDLAYLRLMRAQADCATGYEPAEIGKWAAGAQAWVAQSPSRRVLAFFISGAKERNPAAAMEMLRQLGGGT
jgi:uncharacterized protein YecE (DUF72 family)